MTDREARLDLHAPVVDVQIRAAYAAGLDRDDRVVAALERRLWPLVDPHFVGSLEGDGPHRALILSSG